MTITIGSILIKDYETLKWTTRRQNEIVSIPYGPQQINSVTGVELVEYQITGSIFSDSTAPKLLRRQLTELFNNNTREFSYIEFSEDGNELTGWFLLDNFSTEIIPGTFHYNFNMTVRRLSLDNAQMIALYAQDDTPLISDYTGLSERRWVAMPNGQGDGSHLLRTGTTGTTRVPINSSVHYMPYTQTSIINDFRCRIYDTMVKGSLEFFVNSSNIFETTWEERYALGNNFEGDVVISNGLIRVVFFNPSSITSPGKYDIHIWSGSRWEWGCRDFTPVIREVLPTYPLAVFQPPTIIHFSNDKIEFIQWYTNGINIFFGIKSILRYGSYFISKELVTSSDILGTSSSVTGHFAKGYTTLSGSSSVITDNYSTVEFQTGTGFNFNMGILYTKIPTPLIIGLSVFLGYTVPINTRFQLGVFVLPNPPSAGTTLANIGREYLSNSTQKRVLINPKWM